MIRAAFMAHIAPLWRGLRYREQLSLAALSAVFCLFILYLGVLRPMAAALDASAARLDAARREAGRVQALLQLARGRAADNTPARARVTQAASAAGFTINALRNQGAGRFSVSLRAIAAPTLFSWLAALDQQGVQPRAVRLTKDAKSDRLNAEIIFEGG